MPYLTNLDVRIIRKGQVQLLADFQYRIPDTDTIILVPEGAKSDFASIPRMFRWFVSGTDKTRKPAVIHDYLYRNGIGTRKWADQVFRMAMKESRMGWKRHAVYYGVRVGGSFAWVGKAIDKVA